MVRYLSARRVKDASGKERILVGKAAEQYQREQGRAATKEAQAIKAGEEAPPEIKYYLTVRGLKTYSVVGKKPEEAVMEISHKEYYGSLSKETIEKFNEGKWEEIRPGVFRQESKKFTRVVDTTGAGEPQPGSPAARMQEAAKIRLLLRKGGGSAAVRRKLSEVAAEEEAAAMEGGVPSRGEIEFYYGSNAYAMPYDLTQEKGLMDLQTAYSKATGDWVSPSLLTFGKGDFAPPPKTLAGAYAVSTGDVFGASILPLTVRGWGRGERWVWEGPGEMRIKETFEGNLAGLARRFYEESKINKGFGKRVIFGIASIGTTAISDVYSTVRHPIESIKSLFSPASWKETYKVFRGKAAAGDVTLLGNVIAMGAISKGVGLGFRGVKAAFVKTPTLKVVMGKGFKVGKIVLERRIGEFSRSNFEITRSIKIFPKLKAVLGKRVFVDRSIIGSIENIKWRKVEYPNLAKGFRAGEVMGRGTVFTIKRGFINTLLGRTEVIKSKVILKRSWEYTVEKPKMDIALSRIKGYVKPMIKTTYSTRAFMAGHPIIKGFESYGKRLRIESLKVPKQTFSMYARVEAFRGSVVKFERIRFGQKEIAVFGFGRVKKGNVLMTSVDFAVPKTRLFAGWYAGVKAGKLLGISTQKSRITNKIRAPGGEWAQFGSVQTGAWFKGNVLAKVAKQSGYWRQIGKPGPLDIKFVSSGKGMKSVSVQRLETGQSMLGVRSMVSQVLRTESNNRGVVVGKNILKSVPLISVQRSSLRLGQRSVLRVGLRSQERGILKEGLRSVQRLNVRSQLRYDLRSQLRPQLRVGLRNQMRTQVRTGLRSALRTQLREGIRMAPRPIIITPPPPPPTGGGLWVPKAKPRKGALIDRGVFDPFKKSYMPDLTAVLSGQMGKMPSLRAIATGIVPRPFVR